MSSDTEKQKFQGKQKAKRRTRKDGEGRDFACACGKSYLSYPALYTHVKTKHNGRAPLTGVGGIKFELNDELAEQKNPLMAIHDQLEKYLQKISKEDNKEFFPAFQSEDLVYLKDIKKEWQDNKENQQNNGFTFCTSIDLIFARFLTEMEQKTSQQGNYYLQNLILNLRKGIIKQKNSMNFCKQNSGQQLPNFFNAIILNNYITTPQNKRQEKVISHKVLTLKLLFFFASWMFQENYTNLTVKFNPV